MLAGLDPSALPERTPLPVWAADRQQPDEEQHDDIMVLANPAVQVWREAAAADAEQMHPRPVSTGWRVVPTGLPRKMWCVRRLTFTTEAGAELPHAESSGCWVVASGEGVLNRKWAPDNAFQDDAAEGCALKDQHGHYYIGILCDRGYEVNRVEVMQLTLEHSASSAKIQQFVRGRWLDIGGAVDMPVAAAKIIFVAATCAPGVCGGEWTPRTGDSAPKTCARRACNIGECCRHKGTCGASTCVTPYWGLKFGAKGALCVGRECDESFCCEKKDICRPGVCSSNQHLKPYAPQLCKTSACAVDECCEAPVCTEELCGVGTPLHVNVTCKERYCTAVECCVPMNLPREQALCEQSVCARAGMVFGKMAFGRRCAGWPCTMDECCAPVQSALVLGRSAVELVPTPRPLTPGSLAPQAAIGLVGGLTAASLALVVATVSRTGPADRRRDPEAEEAQAFAALDA